MLADTFLKAVELEKTAEVEAVDLLLSCITPKKLASQGLALINLHISAIRTGLGGRTLLELSNDMGYNDEPEIDPGAIRVGDIVKIEASKKANPESIEAVVTKIGLKLIVVALEEQEEQKMLNLELERVWMVKMANNITYKRMESLMRKLKELKSHSPLVQLLLGESKHIAPSPVSIKFENELLNESQKTAIANSISASLSIIHGPPGTGKTHTVVELIQQLLKHGCRRILVCGPSNVSVDTIVERLDKVLPYKKFLRIGHPARLLPSVQKHSLDYLTRTGDNAEIVEGIKAEIKDNLKKVKKSKNYRERKQLWEENKYLRKSIRERDTKTTTELILGSQVIIATLHGSSSRELTLIQEPLFDALIVDEVSQALEPQVWIPLISHPQILKLILAGDNKQLPPTVKMGDYVSTDESRSLQKALETTLFDRMVQLHGEKGLVHLLNVQYRMNEKIMEFSLEVLYKGQLIADASVKDHTLKDLDDVVSNDDTIEPVVWYDTQGGDYPEQEEEGGITASKFNEGEALLSKHHVEALIDSGVKPSEIGVISPYSAQVGLLKRKIHSKFPDVEISTVDGFQGREKEAIILSLVRSNLSQEVGFLLDERRLNVAMTRPRRQLCVIGDMETISGKNRFLKKWAEWAEEKSDLRYFDSGDLQWD